MVEYVGPLFEELKGETRHLGKEIGLLKETTSGLGKEIGLLKQTTSGLGKEIGLLKQTTSGLGKEIGLLKETTSGLGKEVHGMGILMEHMDGKIDLALEASSSVLKHDATVRGHEDRISSLEKDVKILKSIKTTKQ